MNFDFFNTNPIDSFLFESFSTNTKKDIESKFIKINLKPGEKIFQFNEYCPGIIFIKKGSLRLLVLDEKNEILTFSIYKKKSILGISQVIKGTKDQSIITSTSAEIFLLPAKEFLSLLSKNESLLQKLSFYQSEEIYSSLFQIFKNNFSSRDFIKFIKKNPFKNFQIKLLNPGFQEINEKSKNIFLSSNNVENISPGDQLVFGQKIKVIGKLPARIITFDRYLGQQLKGGKNSGNSNKFDSNHEEKYNIEDYRYEHLEDWFEETSNEKNYYQASGFGSINETLACFKNLTKFFNLPFRKDLLKQILIDQEISNNNMPFNIRQIAMFCNLIGLNPIPIKPIQKKEYRLLPFPLLVLEESKPSVIWKYSKNMFLTSNPREGKKWIPFEQFYKIAFKKDTYLLFIEKKSNLSDSKFNLKWFLPEIKKYYSSLTQVFLASFFVQLLGLFNPLLIQQIIDSVISQGNIGSLNVLGTFLIVMALTQAILSALRTYLFTDTTNRIDISAGGKIVKHLIRLPINFFHNRPVGEISNRLNELERIRNFLTGKALNIFLDALFSFIYIIVMLIYSVKLTIWALSVIPFFILLTLIISPIIKVQLRNKAEANAKVQSHLVETITSIDTIKTQAIEFHKEWKWENLYERKIKASFINIITSTAAGSVNQFLQQLSGLIIIWVGANLVLQGEMTIGQLIAFRILSNFVTNPLLRLANIWQDFQETSLSIDRLSDIMDQREDGEASKGYLSPMSKISGEIEMRLVNFKFNEFAPLQLKNINLNISKGSKVGIVGESGSGKSTLLRLLAKINTPTSGDIKIDGIDISKVELNSYRNQIGMVPQENVLFEGTILQNIAITNPQASLEKIYFASKLACAHDFINSLPSGYETYLGERGKGLSGGQCQRIAIARMILKNPQLIIFDEATSALDLKTERLLLNNIFSHFKDKTILFSTHKLSSLAKTDHIILLNNGIIEEKGTHNELISLKGRYSTMFKN